MENIDMAMEVHFIMGEGITAMYKPLSMVLEERCEQVGKTNSNRAFVTAGGQFPSQAVQAEIRALRAVGFFFFFFFGVYCN
jgi:hypothetical protein